MTVDDVVDARQASIVAFHGGLPRALGELVARLQQELAVALGSAFVPRPAEQVHATVVGLEIPPPVHAGTDRTRFDARPLAEHLVRTLDAGPLELQFGGAAAGDGRWPSRGATRHERSFLLGPSDVVLIGWPVSGQGGALTVLPALADIRHGCEAFGARHRYHDRPGAHDPDAYLVIGGLPEDPGPAAAGLAAAVRTRLANEPVRVRCAADQLSLVEYVDTALPLASTRRQPLTGFCSQRVPAGRAPT